MRDVAPALLVALAILAAPAAAQVPADGATAEEPPAVAGPGGVAWAGGEGFAGPAAPEDAAGPPLPSAGPVMPRLPIDLPKVCMMQFEVGSCIEPSFEGSSPPRPANGPVEAEAGPEAEAASAPPEPMPEIAASGEAAAALEQQPVEPAPGQPLPDSRGPAPVQPRSGSSGPVLQEAPSVQPRLAWALAASLALPGALLAKLLASLLALRRPRGGRSSLRDAVLEAVAAHPGIRHRELVRRIGHGNGTVEHHVRSLIAEGRVQRVRLGGATAYAAAGVAPGELPLLMALEGRTSRRLAQDVAAHPGSRLTDVAARLGVSLATAHYQAGKLAAAGVLRDAPAPSGGRRLELTPAGLACVAALHEDRGAGRPPLAAPASLRPSPSA
jgi:DNA-binding MarR family transcriptional regulator